MWLYAAHLFLFGGGFSLAGVVELSYLRASGLIFLLFGLGTVAFCVLTPWPVAAEFDADNLYLKGLWTSDVVPLTDVKNLRPWVGRNASYWIEFERSTKFGFAVFIVPPMREVLSWIPHVKEFDELDSPKRLQAVVEACRKKS